MTESTTGVFNRLWSLAEDRANENWIRSVRDAFIDCRDVDMGDYAEIPLPDWEKLKSAILSAPSPSAEYKKILAQIESGEIKL
jgi:hypothetical protein